ncbi:MAG: transcriptional regulator [Chromatiales bacterium 21-64-14]|nr:MAG: transcriptional regulator [Chromatiales bacterium 21-64-14]HQU15246.1 DUF493 domain-containing protein [Gammaproteobacteria bacterium]
MREPHPAALTFPCEFPIKVLGAATPDFDQLVVTIVRRHVPGLGEGAVRTRPSRGGRYVAVTVTVTAASQDQLDAIYCDLTACDRIALVL